MSPILCDAKFIVPFFFANESMSVVENLYKSVRFRRPCAMWSLFHRGILLIKIELSVHERSNRGDTLFYVMVAQR